MKAVEGHDLSDTRSGELKNFKGKNTELLHVTYAERL